MKKAMRIFISGIVQGVFFRVFIKQNADSLGVRGYVRNLEDGRVEAWLEGNADAVNKMLEIAKKGAPHSMIKKIEIKEENFEGYKDFKALRI